MRTGLVIALVAATAGLVVAGAMSFTGADPRRDRPCKRYCVSVSPKEGDQETVFRFAGTGWRPGRLVNATYGTPFCDEQECEGVGKITRVRTDQRGRVSFKFREGPSRSGDRAARISSGNGPVRFEQWKGRPFFSELVRRKPPYEAN